MNWLSRPVGQRFSIYLCIVSLFEMFVVATQPHCDYLAMEVMCVVVCTVTCTFGAEGSDGTRMGASLYRKSCFVLTSQHMFLGYG